MLHYVNTSLEYGAAKMWCQGLGAQLVEFLTEQEYQDVSAFFKFLPETFFITQMSRCVI